MNCTVNGLPQAVFCVLDMVLHRVPDLSHVILISDEEYPGLHRFKDIPSMSNRESLLHLEKQARGVQLDHAVNIQFTSGTTGNPKGATLTHHNILNNAYFFGRRLDLKAKVRPA